MNSANACVGDFLLRFTAQVPDIELKSSSLLLISPLVSFGGEP